MKKYNQLTEHQSYPLAALRKEGHEQKRIAANLDVHPSTISRELRRNRGPRGYRPLHAHRKMQQRLQHAAKVVKMTPVVIGQVEEKLRQEWSPEQIAGWLPRNGGISLSHERIYQQVRADRQAGGTLYTPLRQGHKKRKKRYGKPDSRGQIRDRVSIEQRPEVVERKSRIGDWEIDLVDFEPVSDAEIHRVMDRLNHRPRKVLDFRSPYEVWYQETGNEP